MLTKKQIKENKIVAAQWCAASDNEVCSLCSNLQGRIFPIYSRELKKLAPPIHKGCRCILSYITERERGIQDRLKEYKPIDRRLLKEWLRGIR